MIYSLSKPLRRLLAVGMLAAVLAAIAILVVEPLRTHVTGIQDRIAQERMMVGRLTALSSDDSARRSLEQQTKAARAAGLFIEGESESIRLAMLQSNLSAIATANGVKLRSARNLPPRDRNELRLLGVQLQLAAPVDKLQKLLLDIEQAKPSLLIDGLQITPLAVARAGDDEQPGLLDARFDVYAVESRQKG
jgi:general secretion pathway protein M